MIVYFAVSKYMDAFPSLWICLFHDSFETKNCYHLCNIFGKKNIFMLQEVEKDVTGEEYRFRESVF